MRRRRETDALAGVTSEGFLRKRCAAMERLREWIVPILALILVGVAVFTVRWAALIAPNRHVAGLTEPGRHEEYDHSITYRFLAPAERGAVADRLTLGCFVGSELQRGATWEFSGMEQWHSLAPSISALQAGWVAEEQSGYRISRWLDAAGPGPCDCDHLFWSLQALRFLDPESLANEIDRLERSGKTVRICATQGASDYDYGSDTLYWNPVATRYCPVDTRLDRRWFQTDPLITLAHQISHAWHDVCCAGDSAETETRERLAVMAENRVRHMLFLKDPSRSEMYPRPGCREDCPDIPGHSAGQAWDNYTGRVRGERF